MRHERGPFWTPKGVILEKVARAKQALESQQERREQRHRRGNRGREQRRRSESIGECRIADFPDARSQRLRHRTDDAHDVARRHVLGEFPRRLGVEPGRDTAGDEAARSNVGSGRPLCVESKCGAVTLG
jgi:hypothetical protein